jgi:hypothetical protein
MLGQSCLSRFQASPFSAHLGLFHNLGDAEGAEKDEKRFFRKTWRGISHVEMPREVFTIKNSVTSVSFVVGLKG